MDIAIFIWVLFATSWIWVPLHCILKVYLDRNFMLSLSEQLKRLSDSIRDWKSGKTKWKITQVNKDGSRKVVYLTEKEYEDWRRKSK